MLAASGPLALGGVAAAKAVGRGTVLHPPIGWRAAEGVVMRPAMFRLVVLREDFLLALGVAHSLAVTEFIAVGRVWVAQGHAFHGVALISVRLVEVQALVLGGLLLADHLGFGVL